VLCTIPKVGLVYSMSYLQFLHLSQIHYHILLISTAFVGSSALILGIDCYTTAGLKEVGVLGVVLEQSNSSALSFMSGISVSNLSLPSTSTTGLNSQ
jgi:hypothetical protein